MTTSPLQHPLVRAVLDSPARQLAQNAALAVPWLRRAAMRGHSTGIGSDDQRAAEVVRELLDLTRGAGATLHGATLLELGPGQTPHVLAAALSLGAARSLGADTASYLSDDVRRPGQYAGLDAALVAARLAPSSPVSASTGLLPTERLDVLVYGGERLPLADASVDLVWSHSVLEHVRAPEAVLAETHRVLRPGGVAVHVVDLRDHLRLGPGQNWLHMLRYSDAVFGAMMSRRSSWVNRLRAPQWRVLAEQAGYEVVIEDMSRAELPAAFRRERIAPAFRSWPDDVLAVTWWRAVLRKPEVG